MIDLCLLFPNRATWLATDMTAIAGALEIAEVGAPDRIVTPAQFDTNGTMTAAATIQPRSGWRIDMLIRDDLDTSPLAAWVVTPLTRLHRWAGI